MAFFAKDDFPGNRHRETKKILYVQRFREDVSWTSKDGVHTIFKSVFTPFFPISSRYLVQWHKNAKKGTEIFILFIRSLGFYYTFRWRCWPGQPWLAKQKKNCCSRKWVNMHNLQMTLSQSRVKCSWWVTASWRRQQMPNVCVSNHVPFLCSVLQ